MSSPSAKLWPCLSPPKPGDLAEVEHFMKRVAGAELNVATGLGAPGSESRLGEPRRQRQLWPLRTAIAGEEGDR